MTLAEIHKIFLQQNQAITTDTRNITKGDIFFALKGENFNGNQYALEAIQKGASYAIIDEEKYKLNGEYILVDDVLTTLQDLARFHRRYLNIPIISLTGSNGKTTTKELIREVLKQRHHVVATVGNLNNHIGVPLTLLSMTSNTEMGVVEMGANHQKEIAFLAQIAEPNYGYITNFGKAHIEGFGGIEGIIKGKSELYDFIRSSGGKAFVNTLDKMQIQQSENCEQVFVKPDGFELEELTPFVKLKSPIGSIQSNLIGKYNYHNILAAIAIGKHFKVTDEQIKTAIENYIPSNNRSQIIQKGNIDIILDAYNANPTSMKAVLDNLHSLQAENKAVILGDMFELGDATDEEHKIIVDLVQSLQFSKTVFVGRHFYKQRNEKTLFFSSFGELKDNLEMSDFTNHTLLIKGSRGMALERVLELIA